MDYCSVAGLVISLAGLVFTAVPFNNTDLGITGDDMRTTGDDLRTTDGRLIESEELGGYVYTQGEAIYQTVLENISSTTGQVATGYNYYQVQTSTNTTYGIRLADDDWEYVETLSLTSTPADTLSEKYIYAGENWDRGGDSTMLYTLYHKYTRKIDTATADETVIMEFHGCNDT